MNIHLGYNYNGRDVNPRSGEIDLFIYEKKIGKKIYFSKYIDFYWFKKFSEGQTTQKYETWYAHDTEFIKSMFHFLMRTMELRDDFTYVAAKEADPFRDLPNYDLLENKATDLTRDIEFVFVIGDQDFCQRATDIIRDSDVHLFCFKRID